MPLISNTSPQKPKKVLRVKENKKTTGKPKKRKIFEFLVFDCKIEKNKIELILPVRTVSEANCFQSWHSKHKRHKSQKKTVFFAMLNIKHLIKLPCKLLFIRYAPKTLDAHDNLPMSIKYICDAVCAEITHEHRPGLADNFKDIHIHYDQIKSKQYAVKIIIEF